MLAIFGRKNKHNFENEINPYVKYTSDFKIFICSNSSKFPSAAEIRPIHNFGVMTSWRESQTQTPWAEYIRLQITSLQMCDRIKPGVWTGLILYWRLLKAHNAYVDLFFHEANDLKQTFISEHFKNMSSTKHWSIEKTFKSSRESTTGHYYKRLWTLADFFIAVISYIIVRLNSDFTDETYTLVLST